MHSRPHTLAETSPSRPRRGTEARQPTPHSVPDWAAAIARFTGDPGATSCDALPSPAQLSRWTVAKTRSLLAARTDPSGLLINGQSALDAIATLPGEELVGSLSAEVELGVPRSTAATGSARSAHSLIRLPLADAIDFVVRDCFSTLHGLRLQRLRPAGVGKFAAQVRRE
jgi:hypothetical protein